MASPPRRPRVLIAATPERSPDVTVPAPSLETPMPTITIDDCERIAAAHYAVEAARTAPKPAAIRAVYTLTSLLAELSDGDHSEVLELLRSEIAASDQHGVDLVHTGWRLAGCVHPISCCNTDVCGADPS